VKFLTQNVTLLGTVIDTVEETDVLAGKGGDPAQARDWFGIRCRSGDEFRIHIGAETQCVALQNLDGLNRDRVATPKMPDGMTYDDSNRAHKIYKYVAKDSLIAVQGVYQENDGAKRFDATYVHLLDSKAGYYLFENTHWWLTQIERLGDGWLDSMFGDRRTYRLDDFAELYRTNLNILGLPTDDKTQEMATLSRLIYGLSSAYLLTGIERYRLAAFAGIEYQRETFRCLSHDGKYCLWAYGRREDKYNTKLFFPNIIPGGDDEGTVPLYEQIYALAGMTQYYRISADPSVLEDIKGTVRGFDAYFLDSKEVNPEFPGTDGYFSHLDYATMRPDVPSLGDRCARKNWNSIGDHIPAYMINLLLTLDPLPLGLADNEDLKRFVAKCKDLLRRVASLILKHFFDRDGSPYVNERFKAEFEPGTDLWKLDSEWRWQKDRAVVGHNLKIAWNLTRLANYYLPTDKSFADELIRRARQLGDAMETHGIDPIRGGIFDTVERHPKNGMPYQFGWSNTKDFWQQEQAILAYQILYGFTRDGRYLQLAREMAAFWNLFFLDHDRWGLFFRTTENGQPVIEGNYEAKSNHAIGYHDFELSFLAHIYLRTYLIVGDGADNTFSVFFRPSPDIISKAKDGVASINVLPDFFRPGDVEVIGIAVDGVPRTDFKPEVFQVPLTKDELGRQVAVLFRSKVANRHPDAEAAARISVPAWQQRRPR